MHNSKQNSRSWGNEKVSALLFLSLSNNLHMFISVFSKKTWLFVCQMLGAAEAATKRHTSKTT